MTDAYVTTIYATAAEVAAAVNSTPIHTLAQIVPFMEGGRQKFAVIVGPAISIIDGGHA